jgi:hypothetical protein
VCAARLYTVSRLPSEFEGVITVKKLTAFAICFVLVLSSVGCGKKYVDSKTWSTDADSYGRIEVYGMTKGPVEITDRERIQKLVDELLGRRYEVGPEQTDSSGYVVRFFDTNDKELQRMTVLSPDTIAYDGRECCLYNKGESIDLDYIWSLLDASEQISP